MKAQLGDRNTLLFMSVTVFSGFGGTAMTLVASIWVLHLTGSAALAALIGFCLYAPTVFGPVLGSVVDRLPRRRVLVWTCLVTALSLLPLVALRSREHLWLLFAVMLGYGVSHVLLAAGEAAVLPASVGTANLGRLNGMRMSVREGMKLVAPAAGAGLFTWRGGGIVALVAAVMLAMSAGLYALVRPGHPDPVPVKGSGLKHLLGQPELRAVVLLAAVAVSMSGICTAANLAYIIEDLHRPAAFAGIVASAQGAGSIISGIAAGPLMRRHGEAFLGALGTVVFATAILSRLIPSTWVAIAGSVTIGIGLPWTMVAAMTFLQRRVDNALLGRVAGSANSLIFVPTALALPAGSGIVVAVGREAAIIGSAAACFAAVLLLRRAATAAVPAV